MSAVSVVIFDWDGTVMDSVGRIVSSMRIAAELSGAVVPSELQVRQIIGLSLEPALQTLFPAADSQMRQQLFEHYRDQYVLHNTTPAPMFAGAEQVFRELQQRGLLLAVATGKARRGLDRIFDETGLAPYFVTTRCADEARSKPHPEMLQQILAELQLPAEQAVMIGDTSHDMKMAQAINMPRIGITHGVDGHDVLSLYQPKAIVNNLQELLTVI